MKLSMLQLTKKIFCTGLVLIPLVGVSTVNAKDIHYQGINIPDQSGQAVTVLGAIEPVKLGPSLMHEHLFIDYWVPLDQPERWARVGYTKKKPTKEQIDIWNEPFSMKNRIKLMPHIMGTRDGFTLSSVDDAINEVRAFQEYGGRTVVDVTSIGLYSGPRVEQANKLKQVALKSEANIVMGTGFYTPVFHRKDMDQKSLSDLTRVILREIVQGIGDSGVRAGIIGEVSAEHLDNANEVRALRASARASVLTGAPISLHSAYYESGFKNLHESLNILESEGVDLTRVVVGHMTHEGAEDINLLESLLRRGVYLQFDHLGVPAGWQVAFPSRPMIDAVETLITNGYSKQLLVSHDLASKFQQTKFGGEGLTYIHSVIIPFLRQHNVSDIAIKHIIEENPKRLLTFSAPRQLPGD